MKKTLLNLLLFSIFIITSCNSENENNVDDIPFSPNKPVVISDFGPKEGGLGTRVVISGDNFGNDKSKVKVFFNEKEALVVSMKSKAIYCMVPKQPGDSSVIKVMIEEKIKPDSTKVYKEIVYNKNKFKYHIKASVTTVAGVFNVSESKDGTALEGTFTRPVMIAVDSVGTLIVSDDQGGKIRLISVSDNKLSTIKSGVNEPWQSAFNLDYSACFVLDRRASSRPLIFRAFYRSTNWAEDTPFYDQYDDKGNYIVGNIDTYGITADDKYVYVLTHSGKRLVRVNQETQKVELIGENLNMDSWAHIAYNTVNKYIYVTSEAWGRLYRFDPNHTPEGRNTPWITQADIQHIAGIGIGAAKEGNGRSAQFGEIEGICADHEGNVYFADYSNHVIWKLDLDFNATILAGVPQQRGYKDGKPKEAQFNTPYGVAATPDGIVYVADVYNYVIRCIAIQ
ncbi:MAG: IPT/TIG domain-containing protein [Bacteroidales bacterium]|nr:IPT/TIG domain-containing protein [Bacteroidales bacterium]